MTVPRVDVLVNNAGGYWNTRHVTTDGLERTFAVNHLAPYLLTNLLLDRLTATGSPRVVTVASHAHEMGRIDFDVSESSPEPGLFTRFARGSGPRMESCPDEACVGVAHPALFTGCPVPPGRRARRFCGGAGTLLEPAAPHPRRRPSGAELSRSLGPARPR